MNRLQLCIVSAMLIDLEIASVIYCDLNSALLRNISRGMKNYSDANVYAKNVNEFYFMIRLQ